MFYVYILLCSDGTLYTGYSTDIARRLKQHQNGKASKYTRPRLPVTLIYSEQYQSKSEALRREAEIKKLNRRQKDLLIENASQKQIPLPVDALDIP